MPQEAAKTPEQIEYEKSITPPKELKDQRTSTQNHLMFTEIKDGIVVMRDGSLRMIILASALNFDLKSPQEQDAIEYAYQGFLNGLHFPIQIIVRSRKLELDSYLENLEVLQANQENPLLAGLMEDYIYNIRGLLDQVNIMNKEFYVVIPYYLDMTSKKKDNAGFKLASLFKSNTDTQQTTEMFEQRKRDLIQRTNLVAQGLAQLGIRAAVLSTQEITELFYTSYNQEEAVNQNLVDIEQITTPVVERGDEDPMPYSNPTPQEPEPADLYAAANQTPVTPQQPVVSAQPTTPAPAPQAPPPQNPLIGGGV
ncbi:hypothetical protein IPM44_00020 [bacterium]|nr:MAG: hypothetical protein IPM44_00020 [bacterium]